LKIIKVSDFGVKINFTHGANHGSYVWESPINDLDKDLEKLYFRQYEFCKKETQEYREILEDIFGDFLPTRFFGHFSRNWHRLFAISSTRSDGSI